jgi:hypothetical protein
MFAQNVLSSHLYGHTVVKVFDLTAHPPVYIGFGRTGRTQRMNPTVRQSINGGTENEHETDRKHAGG